MSRRILIVGAGHDGLVAAVRLAAGGCKVTVLERRGQPGGLAASEEFHPGYRSAGIPSVPWGLRSDIVERLGLARHGLSVRAHRPDCLLLDAETPGRWLRGDPQAAVHEFERHSPRDASGYRELRELIEAIRPTFRGLFDRAALDLLEPSANPRAELATRLVKFRLLGRSVITELLRQLAMSVADACDERFESDSLKAALALTAVDGSFHGPLAPGSQANLLWWETLGGTGCAGGDAAVVAALVAAARDAGVELRMQAGVRSIPCRDGSAIGVELEDGETLSADSVLAACDPRQTLLELIPPGSIPHDLERMMLQIRARGAVAHLLLALDRAPQFRACPDTAVEHARTGSGLHAVERAYDALKYGTIADEPILDVHVPTTEQPELAPAGCAVLSVLVHGVPYSTAATSATAADEQRREGLIQRVVELLDRRAPGLAGSVVGRQLRTPRDLEREFGIRGGHRFHAETALDQLLIRPAPACIRHQTPIQNLFVCGRGTHPAAGLSGRSGWLAADAILRS